LSDFKETTHGEVDATSATARLPGLDIEIVHRRSPDGEAEQLSINLQAAPSFEALGRVLEAANPFAFWVAAAQLAWLPWLQTARVTLPASFAAGLRDAGAQAASDEARSHDVRRMG
jgi:hypothetical protein